MPHTLVCEKYNNRAAELKDLIQKVIHHPDFNPAEFDGRTAHVADFCKGAAEILKPAALVENVVISPGDPIDSD